MQYQRKSSDSSRHQNGAHRIVRARKASKEYASRTSLPLNSSKYQIRSHTSMLNGREIGGGRRYASSRMLVMCALAIALLGLAVFGVVRFVRRYAASNQEATAVNELDSRVEYGTDEELTAALSEVLDEDEDIAWIAAHAASYNDPRVVELALSEPEAISFVRNVLSAEASASSYTDELVVGTIPQLYNWDERWGYVTFGDDGLPIGVSGSGPTCMAMIYMGLTGQADMTPAEMAELAESGGYTTDEEAAYCTAGFFLNEAEGLGLSCIQIEVSTTQLETSLYYYVVLAFVDAGTLTDTAHWVVIVCENSNGSITVYDPTSSSVTNREWAAGTIVEASSAMYAFALAG